MGQRPSCTPIHIMHIAFKNNELFRSFCTIPRHPILIDVLIWVSQLKKMEMIVTSDFRDKRIHANDPAIHGTNPLRAIDLRSWTMRNPDLTKDKINSVWVYDPSRPKLQVCVYHDIGKGYHFHLQVCDNTKQRGNK